MSKAQTETQMSMEISESTTMRDKWSEKLTVGQLNSLRHVVEEVPRRHHRRPHNLPRRRYVGLLSTDLHRLSIPKLVGDEESFLAIDSDRLHWLNELEHSVRSLYQLSARYHLLHLLLLLGHLFRLELNNLLCDRAVGLLDLDYLLLLLWLILQLDELLRQIDYLLLVGRSVDRLHLLVLGIVLLAV